MVSLMRRRREMLQNVQPLPEWDYEWSYTQGLLEDDGWTKVTNVSNASTRMTDTGERLTSPTSGYVTLRDPTRFNMQTGVMEIVFYCTGFVSNKENIRFCLTSGANPGGGIQVKAPNGVLRLSDNSAATSGTSLGVTLTANTEYTIRLTLYGDKASVNLNGTLIADHISISEILYTANTSIWSQNMDWYGLILKSVKIKKNRT